MHLLMAVCVVTHKFADGSEKPIGFVSRTLTDTEKKYPQVEREGLACIVWGIMFSYLLVWS